MMKTNYHRESWIVNFQAVWLTQPQSEPSLYLGTWSFAKDLVACGKILFHPHVCAWAHKDIMNKDIQSKLCPGEKDLQRFIGTKPLLHLVPGQPYEKEAQGWPTCQKDHGAPFKDDYVMTPPFIGGLLQRLGGGHCCCQHLFWQGNCHGYKSASHQHEFWSPFRIREEHQDGPCGLHRLSWRTLRPLSRLQHRLLCRDHLLGRCQGVSEYGAQKKVIGRTLFCKAKKGIKS